MIARGAVGVLAALAIAAAAWRAGSLARSGAMAAVVLGAVCTAAGWSWALLLLAFFLPASALSRFRAASKARRTESVVAKGGPRDAKQVLANGGPFAAGALLTLVLPASNRLWMPLALGALAAATSDTWGTEVGALAAAPPRLLTTGRVVPAGTSGGVTLAGLVATGAGAVFLAGFAWLVGWPPRIVSAGLTGGIAGALADSLLGALWQEKRWCAACGVGTERDVHGCGSATERRGGLEWLDNDAVNLVSGIVGAVVALMAAW